MTILVGLALFLGLSAIMTRLSCLFIVGLMVNFQHPSLPIVVLSNISILFNLLRQFSSVAHLRGRRV